MKGMKVILAVLALAVVASAEIESVEDLTLFGYHAKIGIPEATRIRELEQSRVTPITRIVGGEPYDISEVPYQAGLLIQILDILTSLCGGSLISKDRVLTAAHCYYDGNITAQNLTVILGSNTLFSGGHRVLYSGIAVHPEWSPSTAENDVAVISFPSVEFTDEIQPIALPDHKDEMSRSFVWEIGLASGYGRTQDGVSISNNRVISAVSIVVLPNETCKAAYGEWFYDSNMCLSGAGGMSTCSGDSGGPLAILGKDRLIVAGVTSFVSASGCEKGFPAGFARVTSFVPWIHAQL